MAEMNIEKLLKLIKLFEDRVTIATRNEKVKKTSSS
jgi:hypothetical protein